MKIIRLRKDIGGWMATFFGDLEATTFFDGHSTISTAFGPRDSADKARAGMQRVYPGHVIVVDLKPITNTEVTS